MPYDCPLFCDGVCQRSAPPLIFSPAPSYTALSNRQACTSQEQSISSSLMRDTGWADASRCLRANTALLSPYKYGPSTLLAKTVLPFPVIYCWHIMDQMKKLQVTYSCELSFSAVDSKEGEKTWRLFKYEMDRASLIIATTFF